VVPTQSAYFTPLAQESAFGGDRVALAVRGTGDEAALVSAVQASIWDLEPDAPFYGIERGSELGTAFGAELRFVLGVLGTFAGLALVLGGVGVYGVTAGAARRRTREIGIRIALGAEQHQAAGLILREGVGLALMGTALGTVAALGLTRLLAGLLFGVTPADPPTYLAVAVTLVLVALVASWIPACRAGSVDPLAAMRLE